MKAYIPLTCVLLGLLVCPSRGNCADTQKGRAPEPSTSATACANLVPRGFTLFGPQIVYPGESLKNRLAAFARNIGTGPSTLMNVAFYLSADSFITTSDRLLTGGRESVGAIQAGFVEPVPMAGSMTVPADWATRPSYLGIIVDEEHDVIECTETDNTAWIPVSVTTPGASVLQVPDMYDNIADAITAAADGDTIRIAAGVYDEPLIISKDLVFQGAGALATRLKTSTVDSAIVSVNYASVIFSGLEFYGNGAQPDWVSRGISARVSSVCVDQCVFTNVVNAGIYADSGNLKIDGSQFNVQGIVADVGLQANSATFTIRNCYGGKGIDHVFDPRVMSLGVIENCTIDGSSVDWANGIRVRDQTAAVLRNNVILGQHTLSTPASLTVGGIAIFGSAFVEVDGNTIQGFTYGMNISSGAGVRAHANSITGNISEGIVLAYNPILDLGGGQWNSPGCNDIYSNGAYNVRNGNAPAIYAKNNDWGTGDITAIDAKLYDDNENPALGQIIYTPFGACTPVGLNVMVWLGAKQINFAQILQAGVTTEANEYAGPPPPPGYKYLPPSPVDPITYYDITTSALYSGEVEIGLPYDETQLSGSESQIRMFHYQDNVWRDITASIDVSHNVAYGKTFSLSPFILAEPLSCCTGTTGNVNMAGIVDVSDLSLLVAYLTTSPPAALPCAAEANVNGVGIIDVSDLSLLVAYLTTSPPPSLPSCP